MCYFFGICTTWSSQSDSDIEYITDLIEIHNVTKFENNPRKGRFYYEILIGGCSCSLFRRRNFIIYNLGNIYEANKEDYSNEIKNYLQKLPGNKETEVLVFLADDNKKCSLINDYEKIRHMLPVKEISKQRFIEKYPFIEDDLIYLLV